MLPRLAAVKKGGMASLMRSFAAGRAAGALSSVGQRHGRHLAVSYANRAAACRCPSRWTTSSSSDGSEARLLGGAPIKDAEAISHIAFAFMVRVGPIQLPCCHCSAFCGVRRLGSGPQEPSQSHCVRE